MRRVVVDAAAILGAGGLAGVLMAVGSESPVRVVFALAFLLFGPGLAVTDLLDVQDIAQRLAIATGISLATEALIGLGLLYAGAYSPGLTFAIVLALTAVLLTIALVRAARGAAAQDRSPGVPA